MALATKTNEEKIFDVIQDLKDSIFGLKNSYVKYCYSETDGSLFWDNKKSEKFIKELLEHAKMTSTYNAQFEGLIVLAFELILKFILHACNFEEQQFVSLRKIIKTTQKESKEDQSIFEIMVEQQKGYFDMVYFDKLQLFSDQIIEVNFDDFYKSCKHAIEAFIDSHNLNSIKNDKVTSELVLRISRLSNITAAEIRKYANINGVYRDEE